VTAPPSGESLSEAYAHCESLARAQDRDRWLSALFAPTAARPHLHALSAFNYEVGRLREIVHEPLAGELRLTWWRDAVTRGDASGHPVSEALLDTIAKFKLPSSRRGSSISTTIPCRASTISRAIAARPPRRCFNSPR
jgi:phytoene synthase